MSRSRARLAADWFAKLRQNAVTNEVEHIDVVAAEADALQAKADAAAVGIVVGPTGPQGPAGSNGATGARGATGATGPAGSPIVAAGAVGSYALLQSTSGAIQNPNSTRAGSSLWYGNTYGGYNNSQSPAGTWRTMGSINSAINNASIQTTVRLRIS